MTRHNGAGLTDGERHDNGMTVRREVLGDEHVDRSIANSTGFTADFQDFITRVAWGDVWQRPGLDRRARSVAVLSSLIALGHHEEFVMHVRAALRNGLTPGEIEEVILQSAIYAGVPAANTAFRLAGEVLGDAGFRDARLGGAGSGDTWAGDTGSGDTGSGDTGSGDGPAFDEEEDA
jgi:4-carboxymuconolactone decarboxylase